MATVGALKFPGGLPSGRSASRHYIGRDRRAGRLADRRAPLGLLGGVSALLVTLFVGAAILFALGTSLPSTIDGAGLTSLLNAAAAALGAVVTVVVFVRWRLIGETCILWLGAAAFFLGPVAAGAGGLVPEMVAGPTPTLISQALVPAAELAGILALAAAALVPEVDTRIRPRTAMTVTTAVWLTASAALAAFPAASAVTTATGAAGLGVAWCAVALLHARTARRTHRRHSMAVMVAGAGLAFAATTRSLAIETGGPIEAVPHVFVVVALAVLFAQGMRDLETAFCLQREQLFDRQIVVEAEQVRREVEETQEGRRRHDARNALMAIQGATYVLDRHRDRIDDQRREKLAAAVTGEVDHLRYLLESGRDLGAFSISSLVSDVVTDSSTDSGVVRVDITEDLVARGRATDTGEVVRRLVQNAQERAPGLPVTVRADEEGGWAVVYVEDRGPGVERGRHEALFDPASREVGEVGLGLFVCRRLMLDQGGDAWVENRSGGGARFALCLPLTEEAPTSASEPTGAAGSERTEPVVHVREPQEASSR